MNPYVLSAAPPEPGTAAMNQRHETMVRDVVAQYLRVDPDGIQMGQTLERDLKLRALDLVLIALRLEDATHVELPAEGLALVTTVGELACLADTP